MGICDRKPSSYVRRALLGSCLTLGFACVALSLQAGEKPSKPSPRPTGAVRRIDFNRDIRPILSEKCWVCHGSDRAALDRTKTNLRLDSFKAATADRGGYKAIQPGSPEASMAWMRISTDDPAMRMPPASTMVKPLTPEERRLLRAWIEQGAEYRAHWAFLPPAMPALPIVLFKNWARNPIDHFVLAKLEAASLSPEPRATNETLIRRASLTLTGLPPTPDETAAFLADTRPDAYERVVDRLLASPRYGEHQARYWMDLVRYADTHGLHIDNERAVFPYRDWVVRAMNEDLPFDDFTIWQIAGDLLAKPTIDQLVATGYVRMNPTTNEGGVIEAEFLAKNTFDRVDTTSTIFLGVTMACAKCHDHKYDPFSMKDYYGMYAFFNSTADPVLDGNLKLHQPVMKAPSPEQEKEKSRLDAKLREFEDAAPLADARAWVSERAVRLPRTGKWEVAAPFTAENFEAAYAKEFPPEKFDPGVAWKPIAVEEGKPIAPVIGKENSAAYLRTAISVEQPGQYGVQVGSDDAVKVWLNGRVVHDNKVLRGLTLDQDTVQLQLKSGPNDLLVKVVNAGGPDGFSFRAGDAVTKRVLDAHALSLKGGLSTFERRTLAAVFLAAGPESEAASAYRKTLADFEGLEAAIPYTYIAQELPKPRETRLLKRGEYDQLGDVVGRAVPTALGKLPKSVPQNRLGFAKWLVEPKNPLVSRVFANRIWQQHFGHGIVRSAEDFGSRGDWPTNPELLDYLACRFAADGWSMKKLHRLIVTSASFRQSAAADKAKRNKDPENLLISRGPRFRLDAEMIRDQALFVSGLLVEKPGGRGDKPYQPPGIWEAIAFNISDTYRYEQDHGDSLYRRSLYMFWKRTSPPATMLLFDAPMRETCVARRWRSNTPTQALVTLNETAFVESARAMAERAIRSASTDDARAVHAYRLAVGRSPRVEERAVLLRVLAQQRATFWRDHAAAHKLLEIGETPRDPTIDATEHAAWTVVCNLILNLDEVLTQH